MLNKLNNDVETSNLNDSDMIYFGEGDNSSIKCIEYAEKLSLESDNKTTYHIYGINFSRCKYMTFASGLSNHTHLEKCVLYKGNTMIRKKNYITDDIVFFDSDFKNKKFKEPIYKFTIIHPNNS